MDNAPREAALSYLAGAFLASAAGRFPEAVEEAKEILVGGIGARKKDPPFDLRRGGSQVPRGGLDGELDDRATENGNTLEPAPRAVAGEKSPCGQYRVRGRLTEVTCYSTK